MGIKKFNENEIEILRNNKYTYRVSENSIKFTVEFKELMFKRLNDCFSASTILEDCGYDLSILGKERPYSFYPIKSCAYERDPLYV